MPRGIATAPSNKTACMHANPSLLESLRSRHAAQPPLRAAPAIGAGRLAPAGAHICAMAAQPKQCLLPCQSLSGREGGNPPSLLCFAREQWMPVGEMRGSPNTPAGTR